MRAILNCLAAALLFALAIPLGKLLLARAEPFTLAGLLYLGAAVALAPAAFRAGISAITRRDIARMTVVAVAGGVIAPALLMLALDRLPAASLSLWLNLEVVMTALLAWGFFKENLNGRAWAGIVIVALAGVLLAAPAQAGNLPSVMLVAVACLGWALDNNLTAMIDGLIPAQVTMIKGVVGAVVNLSIGAMLETNEDLLTVAVGGLALGAVSYGLSLTLYMRGAQELGAARSQAWFATAPFAGCVFAWLLLGERVQGGQLAAGALMLGGLALMLNRRHRHEHTHVAMTHIHRHTHDDGHHNHAHTPPAGEHIHLHAHPVVDHAHAHTPDLHHRHQH